MQAAVLKVLEVAGAKGMTVRDLAAKAKVNPSSLNTWLYTAGKKLSGLKKLSPGVFAYKSSV
jgi:phage antirepressor YoqD-like protein